MPNRRPTAACRLCGEVKPLCQSHIFPEWMYSTMYDGEVRGFHVISSNPERKNGIRQKGLWEYLLCAECDHLIGGYEDYAARLYNEGPGLEGQRLERATSFSGIEYRRFKLFLLSLLWRLSVTTKELRGVQLSAEDQERLRLMLLHGDPGEPFDYPAILVGLMLERHHQTDLILPPWESFDEGRPLWNFVAKGLLFTFMMSGEPPAAKYHGAILSKRGTMIIPVREMHEIPYIWEAFLRTAEAEARRKLRE